MQLFDTTHELLCAADATVRDISYKLSKLLRWEILRADLMHYQTTGHLLPDQSLQDLLKKAKTCFTSLQLEHGQFLSCFQWSVTFCWLTSLYVMVTMSLLLFKRHLKTYSLKEYNISHIYIHNILVTFGDI